MVRSLFRGAALGLSGTMGFICVMAVSAAGTSGCGCPDTYGNAWVNTGHYTGSWPGSRLFGNAQSIGVEIDEDVVRVRFESEDELVFAVVERIAPGME